MIFTLGHSTLEPAEFAQAARGLQVIIDTRSHPGSAHCPQFNRAEMERWLPEVGLRYEWWPQLGGWRRAHLDDPALIERMREVGVDVGAYAGAFPKQRIGARRRGSVDGEWTNQGLYDYAWYTTMSEFLVGVDDLEELYGGELKERAAVVCCEALWWKCHRSMIADQLFCRGVFVGHLPCRQPKRVVDTRFTRHADVIGDRLSRYPRGVRQAWFEWRDAPGTAPPFQV